MRKSIPWLLLTMTALGSVMAASCGGDDTPAATATSAGTTAPATTAASPAATATKAVPPTDLIAIKKTPASLAADDAAWKDAKVTTVKTSQIKGSASTGALDVKTQALYSDTDVWFRFEWTDATKGLFRDWVFDGTKWKAPSGQQDRLALMWQLTPSPEFQAKGCAALCHNPEADPITKWYMVSPANVTMDLWQWTAGTSNGAKQAGDYTLSNKVPEPTALGTPFVADASTAGSGNIANTNDAKDAPKMMQDPAKKPSLGTDYLLVTEAVALDVSKLAAGAKIPNTMAAPYVGSRGDVEVNGAWANGTWITVFHRKLDTGNPDDAKFAVGGSYPFGLAAFNDLGNVDHTVTTEVYTLKLQ